MAARKTVSSPKPDKILREALMLELNRETDDESSGKKIKKIRVIVARLVESGMAGKIDAIKEIWDRVEGRPAQTIQGDETKPLQHIHLIELKGVLPEA